MNYYRDWDKEIKSWWFKRYSYVLNDITSCWLKAVCHYFLPFSFLNHTNCNLELTKKKHKTGQNKQSHLPQPQCVCKRVIIIIFFLVNFRQIMWNSIFIKMSGKKTMFQRQHVSLSKKYNAAGSGALYMQTGTRKINRNANKIRCWLQNWICKGLFNMLVTFFLWGAYHKEITQILNGIPSR